mmetsp:Transcript_38090/g.94687  ORF Transcript_38090/g.94687 Transcript_38090/m.94687 type:complete len:253 (-) Transcript_38090:111-869(-)
MNTEDDFHTFLPQHGSDLRDCVLRFRHRKTVAWNNHDALRFNQLGGEGRHARLRMGSVIFGHAAASRRRGRQDHVEDLTVHCAAHVVGQHCARRANEGADGDEQRVDQHEALGTKRPAGSRVKACDHHRHVGAADASSDVCTQKARGDHAEGKELEGKGRRGVGDQYGCRSTVQEHEATVDEISSGKGRGAARDEPLQLRKGDERSGHGDSSKESGGVDRRRGDRRHAVVSSSRRTAEQELTDGSGDGGQPH